MTIIPAPHLNLLLGYTVEAEGPLSDYSGATRKSIASKAVALCALLGVRTLARFKHSSFDRTATSVSEIQASVFFRGDPCCSVVKVASIFCFIRHP